MLDVQHKMKYKDKRGLQFVVSRSHSRTKRPTSDDDRYGKYQGD